MDYRLRGSDMVFDFFTSSSIIAVGNYPGRFAEKMRIPIDMNNPFVYDASVNNPFLESRFHGNDTVGGFKKLLG
jgi:hypothetical protein